MIMEASALRPNILYGVNSEGLGHASRFLEIARTLAGDAKFHVLANGIALEHIKREVFTDERLRMSVKVLKSPSLQFVFNSDRLDPVQTYRKNRMFLKELDSYVDHFAGVAKKIDAQCVITDFEPITSRVAHAIGVPLITLDNQHRFKAFKPLDFLSFGEKFYWRCTGMFTRWMCPDPDLSIVASFGNWLLRERRGCSPAVVDPVVSEEIEWSRSVGYVKDDGFLLCYVHPAMRWRVVDTLLDFGMPTVLYSKGCANKMVKNIEFRGLGASFIDDLSRCSAVIGNAGHQMISEAMFLGKKMALMPLAGQTEQAINAKVAKEIGSARIVSPPHLTKQDIDCVLNARQPIQMGGRSGAEDAAKLIMEIAE